MESSQTLLIVIVTIIQFSSTNTEKTGHSYVDIIQESAITLQRLHSSSSYETPPNLEVFTEIEAFLSRKEIKRHSKSISEFLESSKENYESVSTSKRYQRSADEKVLKAPNFIVQTLKNTTLNEFLKDLNLSSIDVSSLLKGLPSKLNAAGVSPQILQSLQSILESGNPSSVLPKIMDLLPVVQKIFGKEENLLKLVPSLQNNPEVAALISAALTSKFTNSTISLFTTVNTAFTKMPSQCKEDISRMFSDLANGQDWASSMFDAFGKVKPGLKMGNFKWWGDYDQCVAIQSPRNGSQAVITGQYCTMSTYISVIKILNYSPSLDTGICMPRSCDAESIKNLMFPVVLALSQNFPNGIRMYVTKVKCQKEDLSFDAKAIVMTIICSIFLCLLLLGTLYDVHRTRINNANNNVSVLNVQNEKENGTDTKVSAENGAANPPVLLIQPNPSTPSPDIIGKVLLSFSVYTNGRKLLSTSQTAGSLTSLHGIRFLSMSWVILGHTLALNIGAFGNLGFIAKKWISWTSFQAIENALVSVDTFFTISGLLVSYLLLKEMNKNAGPLKTNWFMFYFHRFWRLTPVYMIIIGIYVSFTKYYTNGPTYYQDESEECIHNWWTNLLYVNNIVNDKKMCIGWSWYLANDMQFYILSPLLIVPFFINGMLGMAASVVFLIATWGATGGLGHKYQWPPTQIGGGVNLSNQGLMFTKYYIKPYCRMGPYIMGVITGYILYRTKCDVKIKWYLNCIGWAVATVFASLVLFGLHNAMNGHPLKEDVAILYLTTHRTVWGACVCWVVFACTTGNGGFINTILSWEGFLPLSRLTYCAYLIHPIIMTVYQGNIRQPIELTLLTFTFLFIGYLATTMTIAFVLSLAFEAPMMGLEKVIFPKDKKTKIVKEDSANVRGKANHYLSKVNKAFTGKEEYSMK